MKSKVVVIGHSDGDGHLIAEQTRRNLSLVETFDVSVLVDPKRTQGHQMWMNLDSLPEIDDADIVFFVDLMFSPMGFVEQSSALARFARERPSKRFFLVDHHPLPYRRLSAAPNLRAVYRPEVFECVFGPRSGMMVVAAICERQQASIKEIREPRHDLLALGVRRAAAPGGELSGAPLLSLMRADRWDVLADIAIEEPARHRMVRGRRVANSTHSEAMSVASSVAAQASHHFINHQSPQVPTRQGSDTMPYDIGMERFSREFNEPPRHHNGPVPAKDLEVLVTLLEVAALSLSDSPEATFTVGELIQEARDLGGEGIDLDEKDAKIVLEKASFVQKTGGRLSLR